MKIPREYLLTLACCHSRPNDERRSTTTVIKVKVSGKKNSELYLLIRGNSDKPGIDWINSNKPGMLGKLLASPINTRIKANPNANLSIQLSCTEFNIHYQLKTGLKMVTV